MTLITSGEEVFPYVMFVTHETEWFERPDLKSVMQTSKYFELAVEIVFRSCLLLACYFLFI